MNFRSNRTPRENHEGFVVFGIFVALTTLVVVAAIADNKAMVAAKKNLMDAIARGDTVLPNTDGSFWIVPRNQ